jgi:hypothetical protein
MAVGPFTYTISFNRFVNQQFSGIGDIFTGQDIDTGTSPAQLEPQASSREKLVSIPSECLERDPDQGVTECRVSIDITPLANETDKANNILEEACVITISQ